MNNSFQRTIKKPVSYEGVGLFTGQKVKLIFRPAEVNCGITFIADPVRVVATKHNKTKQVVSSFAVNDSNGAGTRIPASISNVLPQYRRNAIGKDGIVIETIEHLMAALSGLGVTNIDIGIASSNESKSVDPRTNGIDVGFEIPNVDGSAKLFVDLLLEAGIEEQRTPKKVLRITKPIDYKDGECSIIALPVADDSLIIDYTFSHNARIIGNQHLSIKLTPDKFISEIAPARTFCMADEVAHFLAQGLGKSANYQNLLVVDNDKIVQNTLRFKDEFVRHKILDLIGDLYLLNAPLFAKITAVKTGHRQNIEFVRKLAELLNE